MTQSQPGIRIPQYGLPGTNTHTKVISISDNYLPSTAAVRDSASAPVQGRTPGAASERRRIASPCIHLVTVTPISEYKINLPMLLLRHQSRQPLELSGTVGLANHASLRSRHAAHLFHRASDDEAQHARRHTDLQLGPIHCMHVCTCIRIYLYMCACSREWSNASTYARRSAATDGGGSAAASSGGG